MESLTESVYECTLAVEAHMVCNLLVTSGVPARVDGEFLSGAGGDLPLGNTVRVRVAPGRAAEARTILREWEKSQPAETVPPTTRSARVRASLWFIIGLLVGATLVFVLQRQRPAAAVCWDMCRNPLGP